MMTKPREKPSPPPTDPIQGISLEKYKTKFRKASPVLGPNPEKSLRVEEFKEFDVSPIGNYKTKELVSQRIDSLNPTRAIPEPPTGETGEKTGNQCKKKSKHEQIFAGKDNSPVEKKRKLIRKKVKMTSRDKKPKSKIPTKNSFDKI